MGLYLLECVMLIQRQSGPLLHIDGQLSAWLGQPLGIQRGLTHPEEGWPWPVRSERVGLLGPRLRQLRQRGKGRWCSAGVLSLASLPPRGRGM